MGFKKGDKVVCVKKPGSFFDSDFIIGKEYEVLSDGETGSGEIDVTSERGKLGAYVERFELVKPKHKFAVGDKVKVVKKFEGHDGIMWNSSMDNKVGEVGEIINTNVFELDAHQIKFSDENVWTFFADCVELYVPEVEKAESSFPKFEVGQKVVALEDYAPWIKKGHVYTVTRVHENSDPLADLIYVDGNACGGAFSYRFEALPTFNVGDKVRIKCKPACVNPAVEWVSRMDQEVGKVGTVLYYTEYNGGAYCVDTDNGYIDWSFQPESLELVEAVAVADELVEEEAVEEQEAPAVNLVRSGDVATMNIRGKLSKEQVEQILNVFYGE